MLCAVPCRVRLVCCGCVCYIRGKMAEKGRRVSVDGHPTRGGLCVRVPIQPPRCRFESARKWVFENIKTTTTTNNEKHERAAKTQGAIRLMVQSSGLAFPFLLCGCLGGLLPRHMGHSFPCYIWSAPSQKHTHGYPPPPSTVDPDDEDSRRRCCSCCCVSTPSAATASHHFLPPPSSTPCPRPSMQNEPKKKSTRYTSAQTPPHKPRNEHIDLR